VLEPLIVTLGGVLALALVTPADGILPEASAPARSLLTVGGQAAICACWAVETGARARAVSARSYDRLGDLIEAELAERGVEMEGPAADGSTGRTTVVRPAGARRTALTDRGVCARLSAETLRPEWLEDTDVLHVSGYALLDQPSAGAAERAFQIAREAGALLSIDLACADILTPLVRERIARLRPDVALATGSQAEAIGGIDDLAELPVISDRDAPAHADPMGVTDAFAADLLAALAADADPDDAAALGREMAARCGSVAGPLP
jgi:sugar/nucleoside kinase (ribokinase family)